ncbi:MAG: hypothetical protein AAF355_10730 [Myxococcota bacterium]
MVTISLLLACGSSSSGSGALHGGTSDEVESKSCEGGRLQSVDVNNDGVDDIRHRVADDGRRRCTEFDMNYDGTFDITRFYDLDGVTVLREQHDFDFDGRLDQLSFYQDGQLARKELDTNFDSVIDTWLWCSSGRVSRAERDRDYNGRPDVWEQYQEGIISEVRYDNDNDGKPERWEIFSGGRLVEMHYDTNADQRPDRRDAVSGDSPLARDEAVFCEVQTAPSSRSADGSSLSEIGDASETDRVLPRDPSIRPQSGFEGTTMISQQIMSLRVQGDLPSRSLAQLANLGHSTNPEAL